MKCKVCDNSEEIKLYKVREMMFGLREEFTYLECGSCKCLQLIKIPEDMSKYYPEEYYSYAEPEVQKFGLRYILKKKRNQFAVFGKGLLGKLAYPYFPREDMKILSSLSLTKQSRILDVGCGSGGLLVELKALGFENLLGVDPYIEEDIVYDTGLEVKKKSIHEVKGEYDVIMFHHSFEHLEDPLETLKSVNRLLKSGGKCILRVPTVSSYAWKYYKEDWVQLDAPRHFFLHSKESMSILAEKAELSFDNTIYDSTEFQFLGSEQYIKDIPLFDEHSFTKGLEKSIFSKSDIKQYKSKAKKLNQEDQGDACAFILTKL